MWGWFAWGVLRHAAAAVSRRSGVPTLHNQNNDKRHTTKPSAISTQTQPLRTTFHSPKSPPNHPSTTTHRQTNLSAPHPTPLTTKLSYGTSIYRFPAGGTLFSASFSDVSAKGGAPPGETGGTAGRHAVLGIAAAGAGGVAVFGDSNCLDSSHQVRRMWSVGFGYLSEVVE